MARSINVHFLPSLTSAEELAGQAAVAIDVLRASTTIIHALAASANEVVPLVHISEAREQAEKNRREGIEVVLGGERGGVKIAEFDLGNSPLEYTPESVGGKRVIFTSTNGTKAIQVCEQADPVFIGAFVNFTPLCQSLQNQPSIHLVCAGTGNTITREDVLFAGAVVAAFEKQEEGLRLNDQAAIAGDAWRAVAEKSAENSTEPDSLSLALRNSCGGRNMIRLGQDHDIKIAATFDLFDLVPRWDPQTGRIEPDTPAH